MTALPQLFLWCSIAERHANLVLNVCCFRSHCLLTALMSPEDRNCKLVDWFGTRLHLHQFGLLSCAPPAACVRACMWRVLQV